MEDTKMRDYVANDEEVKAGVHEAVAVALNVLRRKHAEHTGYIDFYVYLHTAADEFSRLTVKEMYEKQQRREKRNMPSVNSK